jgi:hypothetical protein
MADIIRVIRIVEIVGERSRVEKQVERSLHGTRRISDQLAIHAETLGVVPESAMSDSNGELLEKIAEVLTDYKEGSYVTVVDDIKSLMRSWKGWEGHDA